MKSLKREKVRSEPTISGQGRRPAHTPAQPVTNWLKRQWPLLAMAAALVGTLLLHHPALLVVVGFAVLIILLTENPPAVIRRWRVPIIGLVIVGLTSFFLLDAYVPAASAQFFSGAEKFFEEQFAKGDGGGGATEAIPLVFAVIRAIYLIYIAVALVQVVQAARNDEDWQTLARTPVLVVVLVSVADVLTTLIIGGGGGAAA